MNANIEQYLNTALWSSTDESNEQGGEPLDRNYTIDDISPETIEQAHLDWNSFQALAGSLLEGLDLSQVAHDFWLTRNRHGAGFWDGDYNDDIGEKLTDIAHKFRELYPIIGDDGLIHFE